MICIMLYHIPKASCPPVAGSQRAPQTGSNTGRRQKRRHHDLSGRLPAYLPTRQPACQASGECRG